MGAGFRQHDLPGLWTQVHQRWLLLLSNLRLVRLLLIAFLLWVVCFLAGHNVGLQESNDRLQRRAVSLKRDLQKHKRMVARDDRILNEIFNGNWDRSKAVKKEFEKLWYGTEVWHYYQDDQARPEFTPAGEIE